MTLAHNVCFSLVSIFHATSFAVHMRFNKLFRQVFINFLYSRFSFAFFKRINATETTMNNEFSLRPL
jgi:hypothetical protein